ncbi:hypothetical protein [Conexibacter woesei]|uniref:hypothetical protein n=1 Tax=Conexibacter woesei TaxID=191495 RepID=UPI000425AB95|nr:hypothetical protein [Conexibacter woesei]
MSARTPRIAALACTLLLLAIGTSTAQATTWGNSGGSSFTATSTSLLGISNGSVTLYCPGGGGITASVNAGTTAASWTAFTGATMNWGAPPAPAGTNCAQGGINYTLACTAGFTATAHSPATDPSPGTLGATTTGSLALSCVFERTATGQVNCSIAGTIAGATYTNGAPATFAFPTASTLIARDGTSMCFLGNNVAVSLSATTFTTTTATPPRLYHG